MDQGETLLSQAWTHVAAQVPRSQHPSASASDRASGRHLRGLLLCPVPCRSICSQWHSSALPRSSGNSFRKHGRADRSWLSLGGPAVTELDNTLGKVFSRLYPGRGELSLLLHLLPAARFKWLWGGQGESSSADTDHVCSTSLVPAAQCPARPPQGRGRAHRGLASQQLGEVVALESQGPCSFSCCSLLALPPSLDPQPG